MFAKCISRALLSSLSTMAVVFFPQMSKAADLPATPVFVAVGVNWDGFYAGVHGGIAEGWASWSNPTGYFTRPPSDVSGQGPQEGLFGGLQLGYNRQLGALVLGLEGDVSGGKLDGNTSCGATVGFGGTHDPCHASTNVMASITGRIGYAAGRALFYAKAGGAFANEQYDVINPVFAPLTPAQQSAGRYGWTLGAGLEYALGGNWSAKAEYDYYNFGTRTVSFAIPLFPRLQQFSDQPRSTSRKIRFELPVRRRRRGFIGPCSRIRERPHRRIRRPGRLLKRALPQKSVRPIQPSST